MALSITLNALTQYGAVTVPECYVKVADVTVSKTEAEARVTFLQDSEGGHLQKLHYVFPYNIAGDNPIKQAYLYLKTLPEFSDAEDC